MRPGSRPGPYYCCYGCHFAAQVTQSRGEAGQANWMLTRLGVSIFLSMGVMVFSLAMYSQHVYGVDLSEQSATVVNLTGILRYVSLLLATPVFLLLGLPILSNAMDELRARIISIDALVVVGVGAAFLYSYVSTLTDRGAIYYETACMVLILVTLGRFLEATGKLKASAAVEALQSLWPDDVTLRRGDEEIVVKTDAVAMGDLMLVRAGQRIAADGVVEAGLANVDEQIVTGEATPVPKGVGESVHAGAVALDGTLTVRATAVGADSALGRLVDLLEKAKSAKGRYERIADRVARLFVPITFVLATLAAWLGYARGGASGAAIDEAIMSALSVLLISCPCALGIATPMAIWVGLGRAAGRGVLFRHGEAMERLARVRAIAFDKTGTLTTGDARVAAFECSSEEAKSQDRILSAAFGLARESTHPMAQGVCAYALERDITPLQASEVRTVAARGLTGSSDGVCVRLGSVAMMREASVVFDAATNEACQRLAASGQSVTCVAFDHTVVGVFAFAEQLREEAREVLEAVRALGCAVVVLTGDHEQRGAVVAEQLGVSTLADLTAEDKMRHIDELRDGGKLVAMVGDGLNDAPALAAADVGIALRCGADLTRETAAICLLGDDLTTIPWAIALAKRAVRTIRLNLFWSFAYNAIGMALAVTGHLNPMIAAGAMVASSLFVVTNSLRLASDATMSSSQGD